MAYLDPTNRELIALLETDGRASITTLAAQLGLSRVTVQKRLDQLIKKGTIRRFTIELDSPSTDNLIHAVMMLKVEGKLSRSTVSQLRKMPQVTTLHSTNGTWDFIVQFKTENLSEFDQVLEKISDTAGILTSETCLLLEKHI